MQDRFQKRLQKKAKKGMRGWPIVTMAFYGPNSSRASKVVVSVVPSKGAEPGEMRNWQSEAGDVRSDAIISQQILEFVADRGVLSIVMTDGIIGCPHQEGIDYEGEWCPVCEFWYRRDRFTGKLVD